MDCLSRSQHANAATAQRGQAMLLTVLLLAVGVAAFVYNFATPAQITLQNDRKSHAALAQVRDALIGWSAARTPSGALPNARPGELPCPDANNDGFEDGNCVAGAIGRVPWKTLGIPEPKDGSGETLWYVFSGSFRIWNTNPNPINSDTAGQLTITGISPAANVIAIVFSPGATIGAQNRDSATSSLCSTTGTTILNNLCPANYLEGENANGDTTYTTALASSAYNDMLLPITSDALFSVVNIRVAKDAIAALESYRATNGYYPFANPYGSAAPYDCSNGLNRGRFPITLAGCGQTAWATLPGWFSQNNWNLVTHYAISKACGQLGLPVAGLDAFVGTFLCGLSENLALVNIVLSFFGLSSFADEPLSVAGVTGGGNTRTLVIVTGRALGVQVHACASAGQCLEDAANADGDVNYVKPSRFPASNDRMALSCSVSPPCPEVP